MPNTGPVFSKTWLTIVGVHENNGLSASISNKKSIEYTFFVHKRSPNKSQRVYHSLLCIILLRVLYHFIRGILSFFLFFLAHFLNIFSINEFRASSTATAVKLHLNFFFFFFRRFLYLLFSELKTGFAWISIEMRFVSVAITLNVDGYFCLGTIWTVFFIALVYYENVYKCSEI